MREQIKAREQEIARLGSLLESERNLTTGHRQTIRNTLGDESEPTGADYVRMSRVEQLEMQIDYLHESTGELEKVCDKWPIIFPDSEVA
jgi:hypothetical protein